MRAVADLCLEIGALDVYIVDTDERKKQYGSGQIELMKGIKSVFDPKNILNLGKICY